MPVQTELSHGTAKVVRFVCDAGVGAPNAHEVHQTWNVAWTVAGAFGYRVGGNHLEMVAGSALVGRAGDEFTCTHDHACGDVCLAIFPSPELIEEQPWGASLKQSRGIPPLRGLSVAGRLLAAAAADEVAISVEEAALLYLTAFAREVGDVAPPRPCLDAATRRRAVGAALWIEENHDKSITLADVAFSAGLAPHHFLRSFHAVLGVTPHQFLIQARLRAAAAALGGNRPIIDVAYASGFADLSNFNRTFRAAYGTTPTVFRAMAACDRKILQDRLVTPR